MNPQRGGKGIPLPLKEAEGRAHTVIGRKVGSQDGGYLYRQTAEFSGSSWPKINGYDVPTKMVDWSSHGRTDHLDIHQHRYFYDFNAQKASSPLWHRTENGMESFDYWW